MAGSVTIQGLLTGLASGTEYVGPFTLPANANGNYQSAVFNVTMAETFNIAFQPWAQGILILPPPTNIVTLALGGAGGGTPFPIAPNLATLIALSPASGNELTLTTGGAITGLTFVQF